jgi:dethiobiotin synthetase
VIAVAGTQTEVGKTWLTQRLLGSWKALGVQVAGRKPVQSFDPPGQETDADLLAEASGEDRYAVCPVHRWYPAALAPPMAADALGSPRILLREVVAETVWPDHIDIVMVETVGGIRSPISHDGDSVDLIRQLQPDQVVLVADAGLGTLNAIRLTLACLESWPTLVFLNRFDPSNHLHRLNLQWLAEHDHVTAVTTVESLRRLLDSAADGF